MVNNNLNWSPYTTDIMFTNDDNTGLLKNSDFLEKYLYSMMNPNVVNYIRNNYLNQELTSVTDIKIMFYHFRLTNLSEISRANNNTFNYSQIPNTETKFVTSYAITFKNPQMTP